MVSLTKKQREQEEVVKRMIVDAHRRGVCDSEGRSVKNEHGAYVPQPRSRCGCRRFVWDRKTEKLVEV